MSDAAVELCAATPPTSVSDKLVDGEEESGIALRLRKESQSQVDMFLCNMQVGFAAAVTVAIEFAEVYSVARVTAAANKMGLRACCSLDLCTCDEHGKPFDLAKAEISNKAIKRLIGDKPLSLTGSPPCTDWSALMNLNWDKWTRFGWLRENESREHITISAQIYTTSSMSPGGTSFVSTQTQRLHGRKR